MYIGKLNLQILKYKTKKSKYMFLILNNNISLFRMKYASSSSPFVNNRIYLLKQSIKLIN